MRRLGAFFMSYIILIQPLKPFPNPSDFSPESVKIVVRDAVEGFFHIKEEHDAFPLFAAAAQCIPRLRHSPRIVPFVQLSAALGSPKRRNPMAPTHQIWIMDVSSRVRVALVRLP